MPSRAWGASHRDLGDRSAWGAPHRDPGDRIKSASHRDKIRVPGMLLTGILLLLLLCELYSYAQKKLSEKIE